jgi:hypothetical protein
MSDLGARLGQALAHADAGDWGGAHAIVQDHEGEPLADWIHGLVHRVEGDLDNARYWYRRSGRTFDERRAPEAELALIRAELGVTAAGGG